MTVDDQLLQADVRARADALDISRSFIVQAPAGSGKTELLIQRYLKLLGIVDDPEEILAITFTRKAAAEMQLRVLDALRTARAGQEPGEAHRKLTYDLAQVVLRRSEERNWNLIGGPRRMRIQTLDALNRTVTLAQPLSSPEGSSAQRIVTDADLNSVHEAAAVATLDWLTETGAAADAVRAVLTHVDNSTWSYVAYLAAMLKTRDQWLPFVGSGATDFRPVFDWVAASQLRPDLLVYFTDAQGDFPAAEPDYPVIWLIKGKSGVPWGQRIQLN